MKRYLLIAILSVCYSMGTQAQKRIISSWEELIDVKHKQDSSYFPKLLRDEALQNKLSEKVSFPELAKRKKLTETVKLQLSIDTQGKIKGMEIKSEPNQLFDTSAIRLAMATSGYWKPAIREGIATEVDITTQIRFSILRSGSQKMKYAVSMLGLPAFIVDSTTNSPACLLLTNEDNDTTYYIHSKGEDGSKVMLAQTYGTVTVGFDIDTLVRLSEIAIVNSVSS
jgi:TonB family protein